LASGTKSFVFNQEDNWKYKNFFSNVKFEEDQLIFLPNSNSLFFTSSLDSHEEKTIWHLLTARCIIPQNTKLIFKIFASDVDEAVVFLGGKQERIKIDEFLKNEKDFSTKLQIFDQLDITVLENPSNVPLFNLEGRYLWLCIEGINYSSKDLIKIKEIKVEFPKISFVEYLPELYQNLPNDSFMLRFISIFQSIYLEVEEIIDNIPSNFEPFCANKEFISWICDWFSIEETMWSDNELKFFICDAIKIFKKKGTRQSVFNIINKYIKCDPIIIEKFSISDNKFYKKEKKIVDKLFGDNNFVFTIILHESYIENEIKYAGILKLIRSIVPISAICNLVTLTNNIFLDNHCYVGVNSCISNSYVSKYRLKESVMIVH